MEEDLFSDNESEHTRMLVLSAEKVTVDYPATALITSLSITVIKFFYFGTALAAHQYLFSVKQVHSGIQYAQNDPWMRYDQALKLIFASIPSILIFDLVIPLSFAFICFKVRNSFKLRSVQIYYGSIFESYQPRCFWWEIINILRKLSIALVLKGFTADDALQSALVVSILAGNLLLQMSLNPWRRPSENFVDSASSLILIGALLSTRPTQFSHSSEVIWYVFALSIVFIVVTLGIITYQTLTGTTDFERQQRRHFADVELYTQEEVTVDDTWRITAVTTEQ